MSKLKELKLWVNQTIYEISNSRPNPTLITSLLETGGLFNASPAAKAKFHHSMSSIFGHAYKSDPEIMNFQNELLLRISNPNVGKFKNKKGKAATTTTIQSKNYKVLLNKITDLKEPGRKFCDCLGQKNCSIINNCTSCGNIVCSQQGSGPCLFCGELVLSKEEIEFFKNKTNKAKEQENKIRNRDYKNSIQPHILEEWNGYYNQNFFIKKPLKFPSVRNREERIALGQIQGGTDSDSGVSNNSPDNDLAYDPLADMLNFDETAKKAIAHKNKLLNFDQTHAQRTKVVDSQQDYYKASESAWLSVEEKKKAAEIAAKEHHEKHKSRLEHTLCLDLGSQTVFDEQDEANRLAALEARYQEEMMEEKQRRRLLGLEYENEETGKKEVLRKSPTIFAYGVPFFGETRF